VGAVDAHRSTILKENKPQDCLDIGAASKWGVVMVVVREQALQIVIDPITRRRSFAERRFNRLGSILPGTKREFLAINLFT
jgi:hypothetical protein